MTWTQHLMTGGTAITTEEIYVDTGSSPTQ
jgi:hypothetical protein